MTAANAPRLLVHAGKGSVAEVVEEFAPAAASAAPAASTSGTAAAPAQPYFTCAVGEFFLEEGAELKHSYVQVRVGRGCGSQQCGPPPVHVCMWVGPGGVQ